MSAKRGTYDSVVSAESAESAVEIALEALPKGCVLRGTDVRDVSDEQGPNSWQVTVKFARAKAGDDLEN